MAALNQVRRRRSELRCTIRHEPRAQSRTHQDPWGVELDGRLDTRPLPVAGVPGWAARWPCPNQGEDGSGMVMGQTPVTHGSDGEDGFEGAMPDGAGEHQLTQVKPATLFIHLPGVLSDHQLSHIVRNILVVTREIPLVWTHDCDAYLLMTQR